jgi:hypothetical protein
VIGVLSDAGQNADQAQVALGNNGFGQVVWRRSNGSFNVIQLGRTTSSGQALSDEDLSATGANADQPGVAIDGLGNTTFVWRRATAIQTRGRSAADVLLPVQDLATSGSNTDPRIDANAAGARYGAYRVDAGASDQAFGFYDLTPPALGGGGGGGGGPAGVPPVAENAAENPQCAALRAKLKKAKTKKKKRKIRKQLRKLNCA